MTEDKELSTLEALKGALQWLKLICEECEIEPRETVVRASVVGGSGKAAATVSLEQALYKYAATVERAEEHETEQAQQDE